MLLGGSFLRLEIGFELFLDAHQILGERKTKALELVQLLHDAEIEVMRVLGRRVHLVDEERKFSLKVVECHDVSPLKPFW